MATEIGVGLRCRSASRTLYGHPASRSCCGTAGKRIERRDLDSQHALDVESVTRRAPYDRAPVSEAIGQVLSFAVGVAISPLPIVAVVLMLATPRGRANGPAFLLGWIVGLAVAGTVVSCPAARAPATTASRRAGWAG
jgi:Sap, sulfolipid-1-addressing protein